MPKFEPVNTCIYCYEKSGKLTREHILASSLGGAGWVLPASSCYKCSEVTSLFEREVAQKTYGIHRVHQGWPSKRASQLKRKRSDKITVNGIDSNGRKVTADVPISKLPNIPMKIELFPPNILNDDEYNGSIFKSLSVAGVDENKHAKLRNSLGWQKLDLYSPEISPKEFHRVLAKTGHAFAVAKYGLDAFTHCLVPYILSQEKEDDQPLSHYVGGFEPIKPQDNDPLSAKTVEIDGVQHIVVEISILATPYLPRYQVVCGEVKKQSHNKRLWRQ